MALRLGKPTVAVAYASKTRDLMHRVGLAEFALALDDYTGAVVLAHLEWAIASQAVPNQTALGNIEAALEADLRRVLAQVKAVVVTSRVSVGIPVYNGEAYHPQGSPGHPETDRCRPRDSHR